MEELVKNALSAKGTSEQRLEESEEASHSEFVRETGDVFRFSRDYIWCWVSHLLSYFFICKMRIIILPTLSVHVNCSPQYVTDSKQ